jgi:AbrB family looped-hinge helix DNA binding protein
MAGTVKKRINGTSRVSSKHQVTIPAAAFRGAGLQEGDLLKIEADGKGRVVMTRVEDLIEKYAGSLRTGGNLRREIERLRSEWD